MNRTQITAQLQVDEGFAPQSFWDNDQWTYGYGTKASGPGKFISEEEALKVLVVRAQSAIDDFYDIFAGCVMSQHREHALVNMCFNLGETKLRKFHDLIAAVRAQDWPAASAAATDSLWYRQLSIRNNGKEERAERIVREILEG